MITSDNTHWLDQLTFGVLLLNHELNVRYVNPAAQDFLHISDKWAKGRPIGELLIDAQGEFEQWHQVLAGAPSYTKRAVKVRLNHLQEITLDYTVSRHQNEADDVALIVEILACDRLLDIDDEAQLITKQAINRQLLKGLAHEIKNPLGGIRGAAQLLEGELSQNLKGGEEFREYTQVIIEESDRLCDLVDQLLGPKRAPAQQQVNIHEVLERACQLIQGEFGPRIEIKRHYDPSIPELADVDKGLLMQAVLNLLGNACQAMLEATPSIDTPTLSLTTRVSRRYTIAKVCHKLVLRLDIQDNGPGVPEALKPQLFYPMITGRAHGTGLGLSIAQSVIGQMGGVIKFKSEPGKTVFSVFVPLSRHSTTSTTNPSNHQTGESV